MYASSKAACRCNRPEKRFRNFCIKFWIKIISVCPIKDFFAVFLALQLALCRLFVGSLDQLFAGLWGQASVALWGPLLAVIWCLPFAMPSDQFLAAIWRLSFTTPSDQPFATLSGPPLAEISRLPFAKPSDLHIATTPSGQDFCLPGFW